MWFATVCGWVCGECNLAGMWWLFVCCCILRILEIEELEKWADEGHLLSLSGVVLCSIPYFFDHTLRLLLFCFAACFLVDTIWGRCLFPFEARRQQQCYVWAIQRRLLNAVSSTHSLSVLLSAVETSRTTRTALVLVWWGWWLFEEIWYDVWDEECLIDWQHYTGNEIA